MARGGHRPGAGRKKGAPNKATQQRQAKIADEGITPLEVMIRNMRLANEEADAADAALTEERLAELAKSEDPIKAIMAEVKKALNYRKIAQQCANEAAPYVHPKLAAVEHTGDPDKPVEHRMTVEFVSARNE